MTNLFNEVERLETVIAGLKDELETERKEKNGYERENEILMIRNERLEREVMDLKVDEVQREMDERKVYEYLDLLSMLEVEVSNLKREVEERDQVIEELRQE